MARLKVVLFGSGSPMSLAAFRVLRETSDLVRVVVPQKRRSGRRFLRYVAGRRRENPILTAAADASVKASFWDDAQEDVAADSPDLICVATFPRLLPPPLLASASLGGLNVHGSLLPRHRGPDPLFWTYYDADSDCGVTLHWINGDVDAGEIAAQRSWNLVFGTPATASYKRQVDEGCRLLTEELSHLARGNRRGTPQNEPLATHEPSPRRRTWAIDFHTWSLDRIWHFLNGLSPVYDDLLMIDGRPVKIYPNLQLSRRAHDEQPGRLLVRRGSFQLFCNGGVIEGQVVPRMVSLRRAASQWLAG